MSPPRLPVRERARREEPPPATAARERFPPAQALALALQRSAGNHAVAQLVARYQRVEAAGGYDLAADATPGAQAPFTQMGTDLTIGERPGGKEGLGLGYDKQLPAAPPLNVSQDGSIAIDALAGEAKEFYAAPQVLTEANYQLERLGSPIELATGGSTLTPRRVPDGKPPVQLTMVKPALRGQAPPEAGRFIELATDVCRDAAKFVLGGPTVTARLGPENDPTYAPIGTASGQRVAGPHQLAAGMAAGDVTPEQARTLMQGKDATDPGHEYGAATREEGFGDRAAALGVNQFARAHIGEAYVTQSVQSAEGTAQDFSAPDAPTRANPWGYHFAAVVAESLDRADQITLENYRRGDELAAAQEQLLARLKADFSARLEGIALTAQDPRAAIGEILHVLEHGGTPPADLKTAIAAYDAMAAERLESQRSMWYFRIVGSGQGQSFHEQMAESEYFFNPLTMVVSGGSTGAEVRFDKGSAEPTQTGQNVVRGVAAELERDTRRGRLVRLRLVGHSSEQRSFFSWGKGLDERRAERVRQALLEQGVPEDRLTVERAPEDRRDLVEILPV